MSTRNMEVGPQPLSERQECHGWLKGCNIEISSTSTRLYFSSQDKHISLCLKNGQIKDIPFVFIETGPGFTLNGASEDCWLLLRYLSGAKA
ncbi:uncharacterized protein [Saccopteryx bilineata]|uniref:uncharacterized protein isoform X3 n=1 Tax=Saccopteryx bilineata TaxID=59482 RepID=UPI00338E772D